MTAVHSGEIEVSTRGESEVRDITSEVERIIGGSAVKDGLCTVFVPGSTGAVTTIEFEPGAVQDLQQAIERLAPRDTPYAHDLAWRDGNGHAHVRAALLGPSLTVPVRGGRPTLGTWQQIVFIDFDNRPRRRSLVVQVVGR